MNPDRDAFKALLDRADVYYRETYWQTGSHPTRFRVTPREERLLKRYGADDLDIQHSPDWHVIRVMGMRVYLQERLPWNPVCGAMRHFKGFGGSRPVCDDLTPYGGVMLEICETLLLMTGQREIPCPCGDVIWVYPRMYPRFDTPQRMEMPVPLQGIDSDHASVDEWAAMVDALVNEVERRG